MADITKTILIQLGVDDKGLKDAVKQASDEVSKLNKAYKESIEVTGKESAETALLKAELQKANAELRQATKNVVNYDIATKDVIKTSNTLKAELSLLTNQYDNLDTAQLETSKNAVDMKTRINTLTDSLNKTEQATGRFTRNVGNYKSGLFSFTQVLREAPAFANSLQTGMMAISNNVPMFIDELKAMKDSGASWKDMLRTMAGSIFSFNGIVLAAVTIMTFLPKLFKDSTEENKKHNESIKEATKAYEEYNKVLQANLDNIVKHRQNVVDLQDEYDQLTGKMTAHELELAKISSQRDKDLENARLSSEQAIKIKEDELTEFTKFFDETTNLNEAQREKIRAMNLAIKEEEDKLRRTEEQIIKEAELKRINAELEFQKDRNDKHKEARQKLFKDGRDATAKALDDEAKLRAEYNNKLVELAIEKVEHEKQYGKLDNDEIKTYTDIEKALLEKLNVDLKAISDKKIKAEEDSQKEFLKVLAAAQKQQEDFDADQLKKKREKEAEDKKKQDELDKEKAKTLKQNEVQLARETADAIFQIYASRKQAEMDVALSNLEKQKQAELDNQNLSEAQKASINQKYAAKEKALRERQWRASQTSAALQALINGALAVTNVLATTPAALWPVTLPFVAASTAIQEAVILAQPMPQFEKGGFINGNSHKNGGVKIEAEGGEWIASNKFVKANAGLFASLETAQRKYANGGYVTNQINRSVSNSLQSNEIVTALRNMPSPVVSVIDINTAQKSYVNVQNKANF